MKHGIKVRKQEIPLGHVIEYQFMALLFNINSRKFLGVLILPIVFCSCNNDRNNSDSGREQKLELSHIEIYYDSANIETSTTAKIYFHSCDTSINLYDKYNKGVIFDSIETRLSSINKVIIKENACSPRKAWSYFMLKPNSLDFEEFVANLNKFNKNDLIIEFEQEYLVIQTTEPIYILKNLTYH